MRILLITNYFNPPRGGGSANSISLIYNGLKEKGYAVDLLIFDKKDLEKEYQKTSFGEFYRKDDFFSVLNEISKIKDGEYDIIHQYGGGLNKDLLPLICRRFKKTKIVTTYNGIWPACWNYLNYDKLNQKCCSFPKNFKCAIQKRKKSKKIFSLVEYIYRKFQRIIAKRYDKYFVLSEPLKTLFSKGGFPKNEITVIPNFYDPDLYKKIKTQKINQTEKIIIIYVGFIKKRKGVHNLLKAFGKISNDNVELRIMGDGPEKKALEKKYGKDHRIVFLGHAAYKSNKFVKNFKEADIFIHPGLWPEPFGRTILEAAISKTAIIVSDVGAPPEVLKDKALKYSPRDADDLANKLGILTNNTKKRKELAVKAHDYIIDNYNIEKSLDKLEREYKKLIDT